MNGIGEEKHEIYFFDRVVCVDGEVVNVLSRFK